MAFLWSDIRKKLFSEVLEVLLVDYVMVTDVLRRQEWRNDIRIKCIQSYFTGFEIKELTPGYLQQAARS